MEMNFKIMFLFPFTLMISCKRWDPNQQFSEEIFQKQRVKIAEQVMNTTTKTFAKFKRAPVTP